MGREFGPRLVSIQIDTRVCMRMTKSVDMVCLLGQMEMSTKEVILMITDMATDKCIGNKNVATKVIGRMESNCSKVISILVR